MISEEELSMVGEDTLLGLSSVSDLEIKELKEQLNLIPPNTTLPQDDFLDRQLEVLKQRQADNQRLRHKAEEKEKEEERKRGEERKREEERKRGEERKREGKAQKQQHDSSVSALEGSIALEVPGQSGLMEQGSEWTDSNVKSLLSSELHGRGVDSNVSKTVMRENKGVYKKKVPAKGDQLVKQIMKQHQLKQAQLHKKDQQIHIQQEVDKKQIKKKVVRPIKVEPTLDFKITNQPKQQHKVSHVHRKSNQEALFQEENADMGDQGIQERSEGKGVSKEEKVKKKEVVGKGITQQEKEKKREVVKGLADEEREKKGQVTKLLQMKREKQKKEEEKEMAQYKLLKEKQARLGQQRKEEALAKNVILKKGAKEERRLEKKVDANQAIRAQEARDNHKQEYYRLREQLSTIRQQNKALEEQLGKTTQERRAREEEVQGVLAGEKVVEVETNVFALAEEGRGEVHMATLQAVAGHELTHHKVVTKVVGRMVQQGLSLEEVFRKLDLNGDQLLTKEEITSQLGQVVHLDQDEMHVLLGLVDSNQDDLLSLEEFGQCIETPLREHQAWRETLLGVSLEDPLSLEQALLHFQTSTPFLKHQPSSADTSSAVATLTALQQRQKQAQDDLLKERAASIRQLTKCLEEEQQAVENTEAEAKRLKEELAEQKRTAMVEETHLARLKELHVSLLREEDRFVYAQQQFRVLQRKVDMQGDLKEEMGPVIAKILKYRTSLYDHDVLTLNLAAIKIQSMFRRQKALRLKNMKMGRMIRKVKIIQKRIRAFLLTCQRRKKQRVALKRITIIVRNCVFKREYSMFIRKLREYVILNRNQMSRLQLVVEENKTQVVPIQDIAIDSEPPRQQPPNVNRSILTIEQLVEPLDHTIQTMPANSTCRLPDTFLRKTCEICKVKDIKVVCQECEDQREVCEGCFRDSHKIKRKKNHRLEFLKSSFQQEESSLGEIKARLEKETVAELTAFLDAEDKSMLGVLEEYQFRNLLLTLPSLQEQDVLINQMLDYCRAFCLANLDNLSPQKRRAHIDPGLKYIDYLKFLSLF